MYRGEVLKTSPPKSYITGRKIPFPRLVTLPAAELEILIDRQGFHLFHSIRNDTESSYFGGLMNNPADHRSQFASDNVSGLCPEALEGFTGSDRGWSPAYGDDPLTVRACNLIREYCGMDCDVFFVFTGTAANSLALASICGSYSGIICHEWSHIVTDECGAPGFFTGGGQFLTVGGGNGKIRPEQVRETVQSQREIHGSKPAALSITESTEIGTTYTLEELSALKKTARNAGLNIHMDGARFANAAAHLQCGPAEIIQAAGLDVLCLGGTKNGMYAAEAVVFFNRDAARDFPYRCKQGGQLSSKMRYQAAQWAAVLEPGVFTENARRSNSMAEYLERKLTGIPGITIAWPRESNGVFIRCSDETAAGAKKRGWVFHEFFAGTWRLMCSWNTTKESIDALAADFSKEAE